MGEGISGKRIKEIREARRPSWSKGKLAKMAGVSRSLLSELESGKRQQVRTGTAKKIADALGVLMDDLTDDAITRQAKTVAANTGLDEWESLTEDQREDVRSFTRWVLSQGRGKEGAKEEGPE